MLRLLAALWLGVVALIGAGCSSSAQQVEARATSEPTSATRGGLGPTYGNPSDTFQEPTGESVGDDVTDQYIIGGEDTRVSPHGKTRSSIPDQIIVCTVLYFNDATGTMSEYELDVDFEDGRPARINFPSGGWRSTDYAVETVRGWELEDGNRTYVILFPFLPE